MSQAPRSPPFRAEHLGSLLQPKELLEKRAAFEYKQLSREATTQAEDEAIKMTVQMQTEIGFRGITDGEYRRAVFWGTFFEELEGMTEIRNPSMDLFRSYVPDIEGFIEKGHTPGQSCVCTGKIRRRGQSTLVGQFEYLKTLVLQDRWGDIKVTIIAPPWYHLRYKDGQAYPRDVYATDDEYFEDIAQAVRVELDILYAAGVRNIQFDDPNFAYFCSEKMLKGWEDDKSNLKTAEQTLDSYIQCYNNSIKDHTGKMHFGLHICRGNFMGSRHFSEGGYDRIATKLFTTLHVQTYCLEYDTARASGFEPLAALPPHKNVVLGVVTSKFPALEDPAAMKQRLYAAADAVARGAAAAARGAGTAGGEETGESDGDASRAAALRRMGVSPQCGSASHEEGNLLGWEDMRAKLALVRRIADEVWPGEA